MSGENTASGEAKIIPMDDGGDGRQRSTIQFPYNNLNDAIEVAQAIHDNVGTGDGDDTQLSAWMKMSPKSSGFRVQLAAAKLFGVIDGGSSGYRLSQLGRMIIDPQRSREARAKAFMNVPLYKTVYEKYKGGVLPPAAAFELDIVGLGVAEKQKERARQVFEKSADQAGFFEHGKTRLVMPASVTHEEAEPDQNNDESVKPDNNGKKGDGDGLGLDPLLIALLKKIPPTGKDWPASNRVRWFRTFAMNVSHVYDDADQPVDMKIELESAP